MNERQSNIELLRLVCMFLIICVHFTGLSIMRYSQNWQCQTGMLRILPFLINGISVCAVNTFVLISGYFSIRPSVRSFCNLYLTCAFYAGVLYTFNLYLTDSHINRWCVYNTIMPFGLFESSSGWWFLPNYMILYLLSPFLNRVIDNLSRKEFRISLFILSVVIFYFGWYRQMKWAEAGFNFVNFIFLYFIGRYLAMHYKSSKFGARGGYFLLWIVFGVLIGCVNWGAREYGWTTSNPFIWLNSQYNSPLCVASAICLFMCFKSIDINNSKIINWFAASALSIYLVHNNNYYISQKLYQFIADIYDVYPTWKAYFMMFCIALTFIIIIPVVDKIRIEITRPVAMFITKIYDNFKLKSNLY